MHPLHTIRTAVIPTVISLITACSSPTPTPEQPTEPQEPPPPPRRTASSLDIQSELGVLNESAVRSTFERIWKGPMTKCQKEGGPFIFGDTTVRVRVNHNGGVKWTFLKETNLADRTVETCILDAVRNATWPIPQGGEDGIAEQELPFADYSPRPPVEWSPDKTKNTIATAATELAACHQGIQGRFIATAIILSNGSVASVGIQQPDETADQASDCIANTIRGLTFQSTGSWPAKVSFEIP